MNAYKIEAIVSADGSITLQHLPFAICESVEVILVAKQPIHRRLKKQRLLKGAVINYIDPFEPVAQADWDVLR
jgi:hypothetical protein